MKDAPKFTPKAHISRLIGAPTPERNLTNVHGKVAHGALLAQMNLQDTTENILVQSHLNVRTVTGAFQDQITCHFTWSATKLVCKKALQGMTFYQWTLPGKLAYFVEWSLFFLEPQGRRMLLIHPVFSCSFVTVYSWSNTCQICKYRILSSVILSASCRCGTLRHQENGYKAEAVVDSYFSCVNLQFMLVWLCYYCHKFAMMIASWRLSCNGVISWHVVSLHLAIYWSIWKVLYTYPEFKLNVIFKMDGWSGTLLLHFSMFLLWIEALQKPSALFKFSLLFVLKVNGAFFPAKKSLESMLYTLVKYSNEFVFLINPSN